MRLHLEYGPAERAIADGKRIDIYAWNPLRWVAGMAVLVFGLVVPGIDHFGSWLGAVDVAVHVAGGVAAWRYGPVRVGQVVAS